MANIIRLLVGEKSESELRRYLTDNSGFGASPRSGFYSTIRDSRRPIFPRPNMLATLRSVLPITIRPPY